jgi:hypothetical protein
MDFKRVWYSDDHCTVNALYPETFAIRKNLSSDIERSAILVVGLSNGRPVIQIRFNLNGPFDNRNRPNIRCLLYYTTSAGNTLDNGDKCYISSDIKCQIPKQFYLGGEIH